MNFRQRAAAVLLSLLASPSAANILRHGNGRLPKCAQSCSILTSASQTCSGKGGTLETWKCFCSNVWSASNGSPSTMCSASCSTTDNDLINTWYTNNCGSDNGASEHGAGSGGGTGTGISSAAPAGSSAPAGTSSTGVTGSVGSTGPTCASWWSCHWRWIVMIIVIAIGLIVLGFVGRWLKRRYDRKQDMIREGFNSGVSSRPAPPMAETHANDSSIVGASGLESGSGRNSPARTRDAFMPYGYGYARSESRLAGQDNSSSSPLARGGTPMDEVEKGVGMGADADTPSSGERTKSRRVLVRERSMGASSPEIERVL